MFRRTEIQSFTDIVFNPADDSHVQLLEEKISSFTQVAWALVKTDLVISVPVAAALILFVTGKCGFMVEGALLGLCALYVFASDSLKHRNDLYSEFQQRLVELVDVYQHLVHARGYSATNDASVSKLLKTIAPYVETSVLWSLNSQNTLEYPETFKKVLSTPPHSLPFINVETGNAEPAANLISRSIAAATLVSNYVMCKPTLPSDLRLSLANQSAINRVYTLFSKNNANLVQALYGLKDERAFSHR